MVKTTFETFGRIDVLCNVAGIGLDEVTVPGLEEEIWDRIIDNNLKSMYLCSKYVIPKMEQGSGGTIVNMSSVCGLVGNPRASAYCASKGGVIALTRAMALDHAPQIRVNCLCSGTIDALMRGKDLPFAKKLPLRRAGRPEEVAQAILYLASDESLFVTGSALVIDSGDTAR